MTSDGASADALDIEVDVDDSGRVAESLPCRACGYDLQGVAADGVCPECATAIGTLARGDGLGLSDPGWRATVARGLLVLFFGTVGGVTVQLSIMGVAMAAGIFGALAGIDPSAIMTTITVAGGLGGAVVAVATVIGAWMVTTQEPGRVETEPPVSARSVARWAICMSLVSAPTQMVMGQGTNLGTLAVLIIVVACVSMLITLVGWVALYRYLHRLMLRTPRAALAKQIRIVMWGYAVSTVLTVSFSVASMVMLATGNMGATNVSTTAAVVGLSTCGTLLIFMVFEIWGAVLFLRSRATIAALVADGH